MAFVDFVAIDIAAATLYLAEQSWAKARAKALLDLYGYTDKNGDGWLNREEFATTKQKDAKKPACKCK